MANINISKRAKNTPSSPIRKLHRYAVAAKQRGIKVYHLNIGQPDLPTPPLFFKQLRSFADNPIKYAPSAGCPEAITAWQKYFQDNGIHFKDEEILVTVGGSEAIIFSFLAVCDAGDEVLVFDPLYTNYITFAAMADVNLKPVPLDVENGYRLPKRSVIESAITNKTKAVIVCNPSNPTGTVYSKAELEMIIDIASKRKLFIISDEPYREIVFDGQPPRSIMHFPKARARSIIVDSVSKRFNMCGTRVGCIASQHPDVMQSVLKFAQGRLSSPTVEQLAVVPLLKQSKQYTQPLRQEYKKRRDEVVNGLKKIPGVSWSESQGAFYTMVRLPVADAENFSQWLLEKFDYQKETVMLAPGNGFYATKRLGKQEVRIAYVLAASQLRKAMRILHRAIEIYNS